MGKAILQPLDFKTAVDLGMDPTKGCTEAISISGFKAQLMTDGKVHRFVLVRIHRLLQLNEHSRHEHPYRELTVPFEKVQQFFAEHAPETLDIF